MNDLPLRSIVSFLFLVALTPLAHGQEKSPSPPPFDVLIKGGTVYDGTGGKPRLADVGPSRRSHRRRRRFLGGQRRRVIVDAKGLAVAPGFINMLSWSTDSLIEDGRSQSEIRQGVTTEIMGEG